MNVTDLALVFLHHVENTNQNDNFFSLYSWFSIHNETVNIWTHLIGFFIFMTCFGYIIWSPPREIHSYLELAPLMVQLVSYMVIKNMNLSTI